MQQAAETTATTTTMCENHAWGNHLCAVKNFISIRTHKIAFGAHRKNKLTHGKKKEKRKKWRRKKIEERKFHRPQNVDVVDVHINWSYEMTIFSMTNTQIVRIVKCFEANAIEQTYRPIIYWLRWTKFPRSTCNEHHVCLYNEYVHA